MWFIIIDIDCKGMHIFMHIGGTRGNKRLIDVEIR